MTTLPVVPNQPGKPDIFWAYRQGRDPRDAEHTLVDISFTPQLLPLRRALLDEVARVGECTVANLQHHTLTQTIYRPADTVRVLTSAVTSGALTRWPEKGRLAPRTVVRAPGHGRDS